MGEPKNPHFDDFGILGRVQTPRNQLFLSSETPGHLKQIKMIPGAFYFFYKSQSSETPKNINLRKYGHRKNEDPFNKILKILDMGVISSRRHEMTIW